MGRLSDAVCIITGGTSGIGRACAVRAASEGAIVVATGRNVERGEQTVTSIRDAGGRGEFVRQDVTSEEDWRSLMVHVHEVHGRVDVLVNNAGGFFVRPLEDTSLDEFRQLWRINVLSVFLGCRYGIDAMAANDAGGSIINMSSLAGQVGLDQASAYCASKAAVTQLSRAAAVEAATRNRRIRVNSLNPGVIWTELITSSYGDSDELKAFFMKDNAIALLGMPEHVADAVVYLASSESRMVTGAALTVDGGRGADIRDK